LQEGLALRSTFPAARSRLSGPCSTANTAQFLDRGEAKRGVTTIHLCLLDPLIRQEHHISFFHAASKKDCYPLIVNLRLCSIDATFNSSFTLAQEVTTGTNGTGLCLASFKASWTT